MYNLYDSSFPLNIGMGKMRGVSRHSNLQLRQIRKVGRTEHTRCLNSRLAARKPSMRFLPLASSDLSRLSGVSPSQRTISTGLQNHTTTKTDEISTETFIDASDKRPGLSLREKVRHAMRRVPHPVMIITARDRDGKLAGLLVSSFNTVTLDPDPVVSFNLRLPSSTYDAIVVSDHFTVTGISNAKIADLFAKGRGIDKHTNYEKSIGSVMGPELDITDGLFQIRCQWLKKKSVEIGDHVIMIGQVLDIIHNKMQTSLVEPLIYSQGRYRYAGPSIPISKITTYDSQKP